MKTTSLHKLFSTVLALAILLSACGAAPSANMAQSSLQRVTSPDVPAADAQTLVDGNNAFALDLYRRLSEKDGNIVFSPYSISTALAMTYAGARGETAEQMAKVLHFTLPEDRLHFRPAREVNPRLQPAAQDHATAVSCRLLHPRS